MTFDAKLRKELHSGSPYFRTRRSALSGFSSGNFSQQELRILKSIEDESSLSTFRTGTTPIRAVAVGSELRVTLQNMRPLVFARDHGRCALCGIDTCELDRAIRYVRIMCETYRWNPIDFAVYWMDQFEAFLKAVGTRASKWPDVLWEADDVRPISRGGWRNLANLRTLCLLCHRKETNRLIYGKG